MKKKAEKERAAHETGELIDVPKPQYASVDNLKVVRVSDRGASLISVNGIESWLPPGHIVGRKVGAWVTKYAAEQIANVATAHKIAKEEEKRLG